MIVNIYVTCDVVMLRWTAFVLVNYYTTFYIITISYIIIIYRMSDVWKDMPSIAYYIFTICRDSISTLSVLLNIYEVLSLLLLYEDVSARR